jgi:hypothetical protein
MPHYCTVPVRITQSKPSAAWPQPTVRALAKDAPEGEASPEPEPKPKNLRNLRNLRISRSA